MPKFKRMTLRIPAILHDWVKQEAESEGRTLTSQIIEVLKEKQKIKDAKKQEEIEKA